MKPVLQLPRLKNLRLSRDSRRVIGISDDATLHIWQLASGQQTQVRTSLTRGRWLYTNDENLIVISGEVGPRDNSQYLTEVRSADGTQLLRSFSGPIEAISPSGNLLVSTVRPLWKGYYFTNRNNYDVWDIRTGNRVARLNVSANPLGQPAAELNILGDSRTFSPDEHQFVLSRHDGLISFYDLENRSSAPIEQSSNDSGRTVLEFKEVIAGASVMPDGSIEAYGTGAESNLHKTADPAGNVKSFSNTLSGLGNDIALSDDSSSYNFNGSYSYKVWLRGSNAPAVLKVDGETGMRNVVLSKWNTEKATAETQVVASKAKKVGQQLFVLVGAVPVRGGQKLVVLWKKAQRKKATDTSISANRSDGLIEIVDITSGKLLNNLQVPANIRNLDTLTNAAWSYDSTLLAMSDIGSNVYLWDVVSGKQTGLLSETKPVLDISTRSRTWMGFLPQLAFTPDNRFLAVGRDDGSIYLYSLSTFLPVAQIGKTDQQIKWMNFSPDGHTLYGVTWYGNKVLAWDVPKL